MNNYTSVQDLIVKAAFYDGVTTTISEHESGALKITFSKGNRQSATLIDMRHNFKDHEYMSLCYCKDALHDLLWGRYDEIKVKEN